jgi:hypothetical protein
MKALLVAYRYVVGGIGFLVLVVMISAISYRAGFNARCQVGNMTRALNSLPFDS